MDEFTKIIIPPETDEELEDKYPGMRGSFCNIKRRTRPLETEEDDFESGRK